MRTRISLLAAAALLIFALPARAQNAAVDSRWLAFLGCWEPVESAKSALCVVPSGTSAVDLVKIAKGQVVSREHIVATGARTETTEGDCKGWQTAEWSNIGVRVYLHSTETCAGAINRDGSGILAMTGDGKGEWVYIQGVTLAGAAGQTGVRVERYRELTGNTLLPDEVSAVMPRDLVSTMRARAAALAPLAINDVVEASHKVDAPVIQAWLVERGRPFVVDAKKLVALADAGVPSPVIDLIVALSYPKAFAINGAARQGERLANRAAIDSTYDAYAYVPGCSSYYMLDPYYSCGSYGYGYGYSAYGYGYPYGYGYWNSYPVIIVHNPPGGGGSNGGGGSPRSHGRVVNGQGYQGGDGGGVAQPRSSDPGPSRTQPATSSGSTGSSSSSSGSSSSEPRTAHRKP